MKDSNSLLRRETLTNQVTAILERQILSGKFIAGKKIPSTRDLAQDFGVSQQVIKSAVSEMERRKIVISRSRDGIYVNPKALTSGKKEFAILSTYGKEHVESYLERVLSLSNRAIWEGINVAHRSISKEYAKPQLLQYELERIKEVQPECLITMSPYDSESELKSFASLPFPTVFIGDFNWELQGDSKWNQIVEDTAERSQVFIQSAVSCGAKDIVMIGGKLNRSYSRTLKSAAETECHKSGIKFRYIEFSDSNCESMEELSESRTECIKSIMRERRPDALILDGFSHIDIFINSINDPRILVLNDRELYPNTIFIKSDYKLFTKATLELINRLVESPDLSIGRVVLHGLIKRTALKIESI